MPMTQMSAAGVPPGGASHMYVHSIPLEKRPQGSGIGGDNMDASGAGTIIPGCTVAL